MPTEPAKAHDHSHGDDGHDHAGHDHTGHDHPDHGHEGHSHAPQVSNANERVVLIAFVLTLGFMVAEVAGGLLSGSLALLADAGHMLIDAAALALAWAGFRFGRRASDGRRTFGYMRFEVIAGFVNAVTLILLVAWIAYEAVTRLLAPETVLAGPMFWVALIGLVINIAVFFVLQAGDKEHVNINGALLHVTGDLLGSVAAIGAAIIIYFTGWMPIDPILSVLLSALILRSAWSLLKGSLHILMEGTPGNVVIDELREHIVQTVPGVAQLSHVHVWSITSGRPAATLELRLAAGADPAVTSRAVKAELRKTYGIVHTTVEIDWGNGAPECDLLAGDAAAP
ncbi:cation diffusion facilitator family transporter [Devosia sp.]|uniref:cation diffusion facilitator family transporter n=1 Tax=Devosia sp. TaxID=1871048 RepID=UPI0032666A48